MTRSDVNAYLETENEEVVPLYAKKYALYQIPQSKAWDGDNKMYRLATRPGGGFGQVGTDNALNSTGTSKGTGRYNIDVAKVAATIHPDEVLLAMTNAGAFKKIGDMVSDCETDFNQHQEILTAGNKDGLLGTHASGSTGQTVLTGVCGPEGTTHIQKTWLWKKQAVQIGNDSNKENAIIASIVYVPGTQTYTITLAANLTNTQSNASIYIFGTSVTGTIILPGLLYLADDTNTLGESTGGEGATINRTTAANSDYRSFVADKDAVIDTTFEDDPVGVIEAAAMIGSANAAGLEDMVNLHFYHPRVISYITRKLKDKVSYTGKSVYGWPVLDDILPGHKFVMGLFSWPFGWGVGIGENGLDRWVLKGPKWLAGEDGSFHRQYGYLNDEAVMVFLGYLAMKDPALAYKLTGIKGPRYEMRAY